MMGVRRLFGVLLAWACWFGPAFGQSAPALLIADAIQFTAGAATLSATGNVEIFYGASVLKAQAIRYDQTSDSIEITGPITLIEGDDSVLLADDAALSKDLRTGILRGARLVLNQKLQIAAAEIRRTAQGRFTQAYQTVASSCTICEDRQTPLWQIRAKSIVHDRDAKQIYFEEARLEVAGLPIAYLPNLRLPDPTLDRASGFLVPEVTANSNLGLGAKVPYFWALTPHNDLTLTPYVTDRDVYTLETRYRQAFRSGSLDLTGAVSHDNLTRHDLRSYLFASAAFDLSRDFDLTFDIEAASDDDYLRTYGFSDKDRLQSRAALTRINRRIFDEAELVAFQSLRAADDNDTLPTVVANIGTQRRFSLPEWGGEGRWTIAAHGHYRHNSDPGLGPLGAVTARDVMRLSGSVDWGRSFILPSGIITRIDAAVHADTYDVHQDPLRFAAGTASNVTPYLGLSARLPLTRSDPSGVTHRFEPIVQAVVAPRNDDPIPDEDSTSTEFDEANLFQFSRLSGRDTRELGSRLNIGVNYRRTAPGGDELGLTLGRTFRVDDLGQFNPGSGLDGQASDWMLAGYMSLGETLRVNTRSLFDDQFAFAKSETFVSWSDPKWSLETGYTWLQADVAAGRPLDTSEWATAAEFDLQRDWTGRVDWRYDIVTNDATEAGLGLTYLGDCVRVDLNLERRFTRTATLSPSTSFGIKVALLGFGAQEKGKQRRGRACHF